jgi:hypothetical protein
LQFFGAEKLCQQVEALSQEAFTLLEETAGMPSGYDSKALKTLVGFIANRIH